MTDIDYKGRRVNKPKEIWLMSKWAKDIIDEELCRQLNTGIIKLKDTQIIKIIKQFIENTKNLGEPKANPWVDRRIQCEERRN